MIRWKVPLYKILVEKDDIKNITNVVQRGMHWAEGPEIEEFEKTLAKYLGVNYCVAMNSGTSALHATMLAYNIKKNDEYEIISKISGEKLDLKKHNFKVEIKSPTFHLMEINENDEITMQYLLDL